MKDKLQYDTNLFLGKAIDIQMSRCKNVSKKTNPYQNACCVDN